MLRDIQKILEKNARYNYGLNHNDFYLAHPDSEDAMYEQYLEKLKNGN